MNNKSIIEKNNITIGQRLSQARETLGLSKEIVAERLYLKVCTVDEIETDNNKKTIDPIFLRGYIRSYAKLVKIPEKEIMELLNKQKSIKTTTISPIQNYSLSKMHFKKEIWLIRFIWLICIICITITGIWCWQKYKLNQNNKYYVNNTLMHSSNNKFHTSTKSTVKRNNNNYYINTN